MLQARGLGLHAAAALRTRGVAFGEGLWSCGRPAGEARKQLREGQVSSAPPGLESKSSDAQVTRGQQGWSFTRGGGMCREAARLVGGACLLFLGSLSTSPGNRTLPVAFRKD